MTFFEFLQKQLGSFSRCDFYFNEGRVEVHKIQNSATIFVRITRKVIHEEDFIGDEFIPEAEYMINGVEDVDDLDSLRNLIETSQKISYPQKARK